ncbi:unnamed protein product [Protopolystoma xenopodis]|uniref:Uncharacterized protein n=1 Tax=Protopolystoma xenopodis TaxID=117903 RepID=A0A3S5FE24_9PLAT|nr:unnamed protein product [Protopolystoma xenopodis]
MPACLPSRTLFRLCCLPTLLSINPPTHLPSHLPSNRPFASLPVYLLICILLLFPSLQPPEQFKAYFGTDASALVQPRDKLSGPPKEDSLDVTSHSTLGLGLLAGVLDGIRTENLPVLRQTGQVYSVEGKVLLGPWGVVEFGARMTLPCGNVAVTIVMTPKEASVTTGASRQ